MTGYAERQRFSLTSKQVESLAQMAKVAAGDVLITDMTDPDWEPVMKRASAIVTNRGGYTCHEAIIAREQLYNGHPVHNLSKPAQSGNLEQTSAIKERYDAQAKESACLT